MARKTVLVSDMSGQEIQEGKGATVRITFHDARKGVRELDVTDAEAERLGGRAVARRGRRPKSASSKQTRPFSYLLGSAAMPRRLLVLLSVLCALGVTACGGASEGADDGAAEARSDCPAAAGPVVVSVDQWGDIVEQLAGDCADVTTIIKSSSADPHDYEPTPADIASFNDAKLVVVNGLDYDPWADKAVARARHQARRSSNAGDVVGQTEGDNPHVWYGPDYVYEVADAVTTELKSSCRTRPDTSTEQHSAWLGR